MNRKKIVIVSIVTTGIVIVLVAGVAFLASQNTPRDSDRALLGETKSRLTAFNEAVGERNNYSGICSSEEAGVLSSSQVSIDCHDSESEWAAGAQILDLYYLCLDSRSQDGNPVKVKDVLSQGSTTCPIE